MIVTMLRGMEWDWLHGGLTYWFAGRGRVGWSKPGRPSGCRGRSTGGLGLSCLPSPSGFLPHAFFFGPPSGCGCFLELA